MCSFEELGLDFKNYEGGIDDGVMVLEDLAMFKGSDFDAFIGKDIMEVLGVCYKDYVIDFEITSSEPFGLRRRQRGRGAHLRLDNEPHRKADVSVRRHEGLLEAGRRRRR